MNTNHLIPEYLFSMVPGWDFVFTNDLPEYRKAITRFREKTIYINTNCADISNEDFEIILKHEIAHVLNGKVKKEDWHGESWKIIARQLGLEV